MRLKVHSKGFTLIELMIAVVIVGILAAVAIPSYQNSMTKTRRADGKSALLGFAQAMERHFTVNNSYEGAASGSGNTGTPGIYPSEAPIDSGTKYYDLTIEIATTNTFTLRATPKNAQTGDGNLEIDNTGAKRWDGNVGWD